MLRKTLLLIALLVVGCDTTEPEITGWTCIADNSRVTAGHGIECDDFTDCPEIVTIPVPVMQSTIFDSIDECELVCPDSIEIATINEPDGTDEFIHLSCKDAN